MDGMFDPQAMLSGVLGMAPGFVLNSFDCVIIGVISAYCVLLLFLGGPSGFFFRLLQLVVTVAGSYGAARALRYLVQKGDARILGTPASGNGDGSAEDDAAKDGDGAAHSGKVGKTGSAHSRHAKTSAGGVSTPQKTD